MRGDRDDTLPMRNLRDHLSAYANYHRDPRNIATHFFGIPMIVVGLGTLLSRPVIVDASSLSLPLPSLSPAVIVVLGMLAFYTRLDLRYATVMTVLLGGTLYLASWFAAQSTLLWLSAGLLLFVLGWAIQFVGHFFEGKKPAFVDDLVGLIVGPLFVVDRKSVV